MELRLLICINVFTEKYDEAQQKTLRMEKDESSSATEDLVDTRKIRKCRRPARLSDEHQRSSDDDNNESPVKKSKKAAGQPHLVAINYPSLVRDNRDTIRV